MNVQIIEKDGRPEWDVLPIDEYRRLLEAAEMLDDIQLYDEATPDSTQEALFLVNHLHSGTVTHQD